MTISDPDFEQFVRYGRLPDTGMEVNLREIYDMTCKAIRDHDQREAAANELAKMVERKTRSLNVNPYKKDEASIKKADELIDTGFIQIPNVLSQDQIKDIEEYIAGAPVTDFYNPEISFQLDDIPPSTNIGRYSTEFNVNCPHVFDALNHPSVLSIVEQFLGAPPTLSVLMFMWSFVNEDPAKYMQLYHRDHDDYRFCKLFVYITDVDDELDGPHIYISNSNSQSDVSQSIDALDKTQEEKESYLKTLFAGNPNNRYDENLVHEVFPAEQKHLLLGKKGSTFIENTWGIHRGLPPKRKPRLLLQAQYTLQATPLFTYEPRALQDDSALSKDEYEKYVNRLYIKT